MSDDALLIWGFGLIAAGVVVFGLELLIPSAGVLGLLAVGLAIGGVVAFFNVDLTWGFLSLLVVVVLVPVCLTLAFRVMPNTPIGRQLFLMNPIETDASRHVRETAESSRAALISAEGTAATDLHPSGVVEIDGKRHDALAVGGVVDRGGRVRVVGIAGNELKVRPAASRD